MLITFFLDAYHTKSLKDKLRLWFMPTVWRPDDVKDKFPRLITKDIKNRKKYKLHYSFNLKIIAAFQFISINFLVFFLLNNFSLLNIDFKLYFGILIFISIFGFTSFLDLYSWAPKFEFVRSFLCLIFLVVKPNQFLFDIYPFSTSIMLTYFSLTLVISLLYWNKLERPLIKPFN